MFLQEKKEALHFMQNYMEAFNRNDIARLNECFHFPLAWLGESSVTMFDQIPVKPSDLRNKTGWAKTDGFDYDIVAASHIKAHVHIRNLRRLRSDGSLIEEASVFYDLCKISDVWKIFAMSGIVFPA